MLALEGRYETFTVGRNIEWEKVKEIYRLGLKHGMRLATISGVNGVFTDERPRPHPRARARGPRRGGRGRLSHRRTVEPIAGTVGLTRSLDRAGPA